MLKDGTYAAWFRTPQGQGTGIAHFADGQIWGCDSIMTYRGSYEVDGDRFTATVMTKRHTDGQPTVFGSEEELQVTLSGTCIGRIATFVGTAEQFPGVVMEGTLIRSEQRTCPPEEREPLPKFDPSKLPKLPKRCR